MRPRWLLGVSFLLLAGCSAGADIKAAKDQTAHFHLLLNDQNFDGIYTEGAAVLKRAEPQDKFVAFLTAVHRKLGNFDSGTPNGTNLNYTTNGQYVTVNYASKFDRGAGTESFTYSIEGGVPKLAGYHINSDALILN